MSAPAKPLSLPKQVAQTREQLLKVLRESDEDAAKWVEEIRAKRRATPSAVVLGETNRGKSSLVNALLGQPGLSPVDADVATATYLVFGHGPSWSARACYPGQLAPVPVELGELIHWVSAGHQLPAGELPPRYVEVDGPVELLEKLSIVDTPGVGGLDSVHGELAAEAAASATALLFVVDASAPFTMGELNFLAGVGERVETIMFALSKVDAYRGWRQVLEADQALLAEHAPRFAGATFHPVSARMYEMSAKAPNAEAAAMLRERSGVEGLRGALGDLLVGRSIMLTEANTMRALSTALGGLHAKLESERRALSTGEEEAESLRARKEELTGERRSSTKGWQVRMRSEIQRARLENNHEVARQMRDLQSWFRQAIDAADRDAAAHAAGPGRRGHADGVRPDRRVGQRAAEPGHRDRAGRPVLRRGAGDDPGAVRPRRQPAGRAAPAGEATAHDRGQAAGVHRAPPVASARARCWRGSCPASARSVRVPASARACSRWPRSRSSASAPAGGCSAPASTPRTSST